MKKSYIVIIAISMLIASYLIYEKQSYYKVHKIVSPDTIFIDTNNNLIFDEKEPIKISNINYINDNTQISDEKRLIINYFTYKTTEYLLKNKFVKVKNNQIYIKNKKYSDLLLKTPYFYDNSQTHKDKFNKFINNLDESEYLLYNTHSAIFHKLNCQYGTKSKKYKILHIKNINTNSKLCNCIKNNENNILATSNQKIKKSFSKNNITIYFTDLNEIYKPSEKCSTNTCKALLSEINNAKYSIDFALYGLKNQFEIINALLSAKQRGVKIRFVSDFSNNFKDNYLDFNLLKLHFVNNSDKEYEKSNRSAIMHNKFFIFDNQKVFTGSANVTQTDITGFNSNTSVLINSKEVAFAYKKEFEQMLNGSFHTYKKNNNLNHFKLNDTNVAVYFSPQDKILTTKIIPLIDNSKSKILISTFFITNKEIKTALINAKQRGIDIKIINDATNATNKYNINKDLRDSGIKVKTENYAGKNHSKTILIDDNISILGSMNFTNSGERRNDENVLIIIDKDINTYLSELFEYLWNKIPKIYENIDPKPESFDSIGSCFDGIDNDFDEYIDKDDFGCKQN